VLSAVKFATGSCAWTDILAIQYDIAKNSFKKTFPGLGIQQFLKGLEKDEFSLKNYLMVIIFVCHDRIFFSGLPEF
jgi:hypothetical protein